MHALVLSLMMAAPGPDLMSIPTQYAEAGTEWRIYWDDLITYDGAFPYNVSWSLSPAPSAGPSAITGGLSWTPGVGDVGAYTFSVAYSLSGTEIESATATMVVSSARAPAVNVTAFGDSITAAGQWQAGVETAEPPVSWLGLVGSVGGIRVDSVAGWRYANHLASYVPYAYCSDNPYPATYCASAGVPDVVVWSCGTNDATVASTDADIAAVIDTLFVMVSAWRKAKPSTYHIIWTPPPGSNSTAYWEIGYPPPSPRADPYYFEQRQRSFTRQIVARFGLLTSDRIYVAPVATGLDTASDYADYVHPNVAGYARIAAIMRAMLAAIP